MSATAEDLVGRLLEHCSYVCVTGDEGPIADAVAARYEAHGEEVERVGHSVVVGRSGGERPLVLLVGHLDVVPPPDEDREPRVTTLDGTEVVIARGASDMKAGNVVAMACFEDAELRASSPYDHALVLYAGEEGPDEGNELADVLAAVPWLREAALAVILEPTDGEVAKAAELSGRSDLLFRRNSQTGGIEVLQREGTTWGGLNAALHAND